MRRTTLLGIAALLLLSASVLGTLQARQQDSGVAIDADDLGGVVTSAKGPEAGVWVIAETRDLPTRFIRLRGRRRSSLASWPPMGATRATNWGPG